MLKIPPFEEIYGRPPRWIVAAPGRVNVIGEHTDYNDGFVLPMAIERYAVMAADISSFMPPRIIISDAHRGDTAQIDLSRPVVKADPRWSNYIRGVVAGFQNLGLTVPAMDISLVSTVPLGGGLSSSAALEVCTATLLEAAIGTKLDPVEKALLCQQAEHKFAGVPCGIMDQFISVMGQKNHLLLLDCRSRQTTLVPMDDPSVALLVINTNVKHELSGGEYAERRTQCETAAKILGIPSLRDATPEALERARRKMDLITFRRAHHVISENERTLQAVEEIRNSNWPVVGQHMYRSHYSLRDDFEVSCKELDAVVDICQSIGIEGGVYGCRMTGAGFGGSCVALVKAEAGDKSSKRIAAAYRLATAGAETKKTIEATIFSSRPASGATVIQG
ncbi:MAG TPA: galactokinase [Candidatus Sulfopaludibacter sp.]|nr:galactokinase [Candidatus Sulfopaludibacter sp.]